MELNYNYVICGADGYYKVGYHDIMSLPNVCYHESFLDGFNNSFSKGVARLNFSRKINKYLKSPFSKYVYPRLYPHSFDSKKPLCFLFFGHLQNILSSSYLFYLRKRYPDAKLVLFMQDLVKRFPNINIEDLKQVFDLVLSYDEGDCSQFGLVYHPTPMSYVRIQGRPGDDNTDVYFCGRAKGRYDIICNVYKKCLEMNLKCDFHVFSVPDSEIRLSGIHYDSNYMSYEENLKHMTKSKCIIEVMAPDASGFTPRLWEAIIYDKYLITNNPKVFTSSFYDKEKIISIDDFLSDFWYKEKLYEQGQWNEDIKKQLSPLNLLRFIEKRLG